MVKDTHCGSVKDGAETSRRGRASTAPRRQKPPLDVGLQSPSLTPRRDRQSPLAIALFLSKKGKHVRRVACLPRALRVSNATSRCNRLGSIVLTLGELRQITNNFSDDQLIGKGAFGKVYKGVLANGDAIAVKRFASTITGLQNAQYENEAQHLTRLKHPNIVQLLGYCSETEMELVRHNGKLVRAEKPERLLCLEYMPKGSLRDHLSDETCGLEWNMRYKIIEGICYGLHYLHEEWQATPIIHMDLKPANILLDDNMAPKIADFGLSRLFGEEQTRTCTTNCKGTPGYMAPEYLEKGVITKKFDIFSLGVIIIEIITGLKDYPTDETETTSQQYIHLVFNNWRHRLRKAQGYTSQDIYYQQIKKCIQIGLLCVKFDPVKRPTTDQIIKMLQRSDEAHQNEREIKPQKKSRSIEPGFRFHPTEEELLNYYLRKKVASQQIDLDVIRDVDVDKLEPWDIQEKCKIGSGPQNDWYFFSHKYKKYPTGTRTNRATAAGFWKATGRDKAIYNTVKRIGMRKTLVFYKGRPPHGLKSDWIMHEYRLDDPAAAPAVSGDAAAATTVAAAAAGAASDCGQEDDWVVCRVFKKSPGGGGGSKHGNNNDHRHGGGKAAAAAAAAAAHQHQHQHHSDLQSSSDDALDHILQYMGRSCKQEHDAAATAALTTMPQHAVSGSDTAAAAGVVVEDLGGLHKESSCRGSGNQHGSNNDHGHGGAAAAMAVRNNYMAVVVQS